MYKKLIWGTAIFCASLTATAAPFMAMDPRALGMGGTGVSAATSAGAVFYNPALLAATKTDEDFSLELPTLTLRVADPDKLRDSVTDIEDKDPFQKFSTALNNYNTPTTNPAVFNQRKTALVNASTDMRNALVSISDRTVEAGGNLGVVVGIPSKRFGGSLMVNYWAAGGAYGEVSPVDLKAIDDSIAAVQTQDVTQLLTQNDITQNFTSFVALRAATFLEIGLGFGREFELSGHTFAGGITPKFVQVNTYDYKYVARELDTADLTSQQGEKKYGSFNIDVGVAKDYGREWKTGFAIKNLIPQTYETGAKNEIKVGPQARIGASRHTDRTTLAFDLDLNPTDPVGFGQKTQYLGIGGEVDVWVLLLRLGYRYNIADPVSSIATFGLGLNIVGLHLDISAGASPDVGEVNAAAQLGFRF